MTWPKGMPHTEAMIAARIKAQTKWNWLPEGEIVQRLLYSRATVRDIAAEYGCSKSTVDKIFRKHTTKAQRLEVKRMKQAASLTGHKFERERKSVDPQAIKARAALNNAIRDSRLVRQPWCQHPGCKYKGRIEAHHWRGYDDEHLLDVVWLCPRHHRFADSSPEVWVLEFEAVKEPHG